MGLVYCILNGRAGPNSTLGLCFLSLVLCFLFSKYHGAEKALTLVE